MFLLGYFIIDIHRTDSLAPRLLHRGTEGPVPGRAAEAQGSTDYGVQWDACNGGRSGGSRDQDDMLELLEIIFC